MKTLDRRTNQKIDHDALSLHFALNWLENRKFYDYYDCSSEIVL